MDTQTIDSNEMAAMALNERAERSTPDQNLYHDLSLLPPEQAESWEVDGYFILRGVIPPSVCEQMTDEAIDYFEQATRDGMSANGHHLGASGAIAVEEAAKLDSDAPLDTRMSKLFKLHRMGVFKEFAQHPEVVRAMHAILGPDVSCFNSQYIFKNPGVWGQPWHQDSLYYNFTRTPQVGVWLATSPATKENGCLFVAPGSHKEPIHRVVPDRRPGANFGYMEVVDYDFSDEVAVLMEPGDVLIFHSFLMHKSIDNTANDRRSAYVLHYANSDTDIIGEQSATIDFMPVLAEGRSVL